MKKLLWYFEVIITRRFPRCGYCERRISPFRLMIFCPGGDNWKRLEWYAHKSCYKKRS